MKHLGLLGYPLSHSHSPAMINRLAKAKNWDCSYQPYSIEPEYLKEFISEVRHRPISGFNVTIPHKQTILSFCDEFSPEVQAIRAVNTICNHNGKLIAHNTDVFGFNYGLEQLTKEFTSIKRAVILGAGGAARAAAFALAKMGCNKLIIASRTDHRKIEWQRDFVAIFSMTNISFCPLDQAELEKHVQDANMVVQTTPVGMFPEEDETVSFPFHVLTQDQLVFDLIYNPPKTKFLYQAEKQGTKIQNGLTMLAAQAAKSLEIWGLEVEVEEVVESLEKVLN